MYDDEDGGRELEEADPGELQMLESLYHGMARARVRFVAEYQDHGPGWKDGWRWGRASAEAERLYPRLLN